MNDKSAPEKPKKQLDLRHFVAAIEIWKSKKIRRFISN